MVNAIMVLSGYVGCAIFILLWRLAVSNGKRYKEGVKFASEQLKILNTQNDMLNQRLIQEVAKYDELIRHQADVQETIDNVDSATPDELLDFMQNNPNPAGDSKTTGGSP